MPAKRLSHPAVPSTFRSRFRAQLYTSDRDNPLTTDQASAGRNSGGSPSACTVGDFRCEGDRLQACHDDGSGYYNVVTCGSGLCDEAAGQCDNCQENARRCTSGTTVEVCSPDGQELTTETCASGAPYCVAGACVECTTASQCPLSTNECVIAACSSGGDCGFTPIAQGTPCGSTGQNGACDASGHCMVCTPGAWRCQGETPQTCDAAGQWQPEATCAAPTPYCEAGACVSCRSVSDCPVSSNPCQVAVCSGANACGFTPAASGTACPGGTCNGAGVCSACTPGMATCNGATPLVCNASGQYQAGPDCAAPAPICNTANGQCVQCIAASDCTASTNPCLAAVCVGNSCGFAPMPSGTLCGGGGTCNGTGQCTVCTPGAIICNGNTPLICNASGQYDPGTACGGSTPLCNPANGQCAACLDAGDCTAPANPCLLAVCSASNTCGFGNAPSGTACSGGTCNGAGVCFACTPGERRCKPGEINTPQLCSANGAWLDQAGCSGTTPMCESGACIACFPATPALAPSQVLGQAPNNAAWNLGGKMSVEWWMSFRDLAGSVHNHMAVSTAYDDSATGGWYCAATPTLVSVVLRYASPAHRLEVPHSFAKDTWYHVACQYDGTMMRAFVDGQLIGSKAATGVLDNSGQQLLLLHRNKWLGPGQNYTVREVRIGNSDVYTTTFSPSWNLSPTNGTVALYRFNEGSGSSVVSAVSGVPNIALQGTFAWVSSGQYCP